MFEEGDCYWIQTNIDKEGKWQGHFFVILLKFDGGRVVLVNIDKTKGKPKFDRTTILSPHEGAEFIVEESYVNYDLSELTDIDRIKIKLKNNTAKYKGTMDKVVLKKICDGVLKSKFTPYEVREVFEDLLYKSMNSLKG